MVGDVGRATLVVIILTTVGLNAGAQILLRLGAREGVTSEGTLGIGATLQAALEVAFRPAVLAGLVCYGVSVVLWIWVLSRAEVSFAYPFLGLGFVLVALVGWAFLGETLSVQKLAATGLIVIGVVLMAISDKAL
jgi:multidrug transporter EmrE-like cation transporter